MCNPELKGRVVQLRASQVKFVSDDLSLNVVRCSTISQGYLNRQIIILLQSLGVPEQIFIDYQRKAKEYASVLNIQKRLATKAQKAINNLLTAKD